MNKVGVLWILSAVHGETDLCEKVTTGLATLTRREQLVIRMRSGIDSGLPCTLDEVGKEFTVTRERIRQIERRGLEKLRCLWLAPMEGGRDER